MDAYHFSHYTYDGNQIQKLPYACWKNFSDEDTILDTQEAETLHQAFAALVQFYQD